MGLFEEKRDRASKAYLNGLPRTPEIDKIIEAGAHNIAERIDKMVLEQVKGKIWSWVTRF